MLIHFLFFLLTVFLVFYLPGRWLFEKVGYKQVNPLTSFTMAVGVGIALFLVITYILAWFNLSVLYLLLILPIILLQIRSVFRFMLDKPSFAFVARPESIILIGGVLSMILITFGSGIENNGAMIFHGINGQDGMYHSALIGNMMFQFPPSFPGLSHTMLRGYHILYDFMLSRFALFFGFSSFDLYFRFFSLFTAFFYGITGLTFAYSSKMKAFTRRVFLFLLFFAQGGEYFLFHWFHNGDAMYNSGIVQPLVNIVDPSVLFSISFVFLLFAWFLQNQKKMQIIIPILFLGILPGLKIYTGILAYASVFVLIIWQLFKKQKNALFILIGGALLSAAFYLPFNLGAGKLLFAPFLLFKHFMESNKLFASFQWILKLQIYQQHHNIPRMIYLYFIAVLLFFIPPLGIRIISLSQVRNLFEKSFYSFKNILVLVFIATGILIPVFFIQSPAAFNIVQFYWLVWIMLLVPTAYALQVFANSKTKMYIVCVILIVLSLPSLFLPFRYITSPAIVFSPKLTSLAYIMGTKVKNEDDIMIVNRAYKGVEIVDMYSIPLFGALAKRPMYYEPEAADFSGIQGIEQARQQVVDKVRMLLTLCLEGTSSQLDHILSYTHIKYIAIIDGNKCIKHLSSVQIVADYGEYALYERK